MILHECSFIIEFIKRSEEKRKNCEALSSRVLYCRFAKNKFNNTGARLLDYVYHMTLKLL